MIPTEIQAEILTRFYSEKHSVRRISQDLGISRRTVARIVAKRQPQVARILGVRESLLDPFKDDIKSMLGKDPRCPGTAVFNRLRELGYLGGIRIVHEHLKQVRAVKVRPREAFLRLDFAPGEAAQVDWGEFGDVFGDGIKIHCFAMVLCHSRYLYIEFTRAEKFEDFIRCHEHGFGFFGGVPRQCWYDNLATAVTERSGSLIRFNARFMAYMGHHGIRPHACNVARGNEKGRVENLIKYIRLNFWAGRSFRDFDDLRGQATAWQNQIANQREHRSTRRVVRLMFEGEEQKTLMAKNPNPYDTDETLSRSVPPDFHVVYETNRYSVPWTLVGLTVTLRITASDITVFYNERSVTKHPRSYAKGKVFTRDAHREGLLEKKPGARREDWQLAAVKNIGPKMMDYVELLRAGHRSLRHELTRILALATVYGEAHVHEAVWELLEKGVMGVDALELTLKQWHHPKTCELNPEPISFTNQKLNRPVPTVDLRRYDALLFEGYQTSASEVKHDRQVPGDHHPTE